ncbi:MAG: hypothetical protein Q9227_003498 [Pyrenula ochraceoflavens]
MGPRTRSATSSPTKKALESNSGVAREDLKYSGPQPRLFILPKHLSSDARILFLRHPRDSQLKRYLFDPKSGVFEFTKVIAHSLDPRSVLFATHDEDDEESANSNPSIPSLATGHISKNAEVFVATLIDPIFVAIPLLKTSTPGGDKRLLQSLDDLLDSFETKSNHLRHIVCNEIYRKRLEQRLEAICDTVDAGEKMFRLNEEKLTREILAEARQAATKGLPASLEERFVTRALESPILSVKREEEAVIATMKRPHDGFDEDDPGDAGLEFTDAAPIPPLSSVSTEQAVDDENAPKEIVDLLRLRTAVTFITSSYLPKDLSTLISLRLQSEDSPIKFTPLEQHLKHLAKLREEAMASRSLSDFSRKRGPVEDEGALEERAEKKRKQEEEEKRKKANESRGVRDLKKVNVTGMKKMSDFFKKPPTAKSKS